MTALLVLLLQESTKMPTSDGDLEVFPVQHASFVLKWAGRTLYSDPVGGAERFKAFPKPDLILITDVHGDHLDPDTVKALTADSTTLVVPAAVAAKLGGLTCSVLANGAKLQAGGIGIEAIPMYNLTPERKERHVKGRGNGYLLTLGGKRIYISGDTEDTPEMRGLKDVDLAFVCMSLPGNMEVEKAADAVLAFKPKVVLPFHYRSQGVTSDVAKFKELVSKDPSIEVRLLKWY